MPGENVGRPILKEQLAEPLPRLGAEPLVDFVQGHAAAPKSGPAGVSTELLQGGFLCPLKITQRQLRVKDGHAARPALNARNQFDFFSAETGVRSRGGHRPTSKAFTNMDLATPKAAALASYAREATVKSAISWTGFTLGRARNPRALASGWAGLKT